MILDSVRGRLAAWHTAVLALVLVAFSAATYAFLVELTRQRTDGLLVETARAFHHTFISELVIESTPDAAARHAAREFRFSDRMVLVFGAGGEQIASSEPGESAGGAGEPDAGGARMRAGRVGASGPIGADSSASRLLIGEAARLAAKAGPGAPVFGMLAGGEVRAYAEAVEVGGAPYVIVAIQHPGAEEAVLRTFLEAVAIAIPLALVLAGAGGYFLARKSLAPVVAMSGQATRISAERLDLRLPVANPRDELGQLATAFNALLSRLEAAFRQQRQFMADASHELRTPVAILRAEADVALSRPDRSPAEYRESLEVVRDAAGRLTHVVDDLFMLARADAGQYPLSPEDLYLEELLADCVRAMRSLAERRGVRLEYAPGAEAPWRGDEALLRHLVLNLLDNAIKHTPTGGLVAVELATEESAYAIRVRDTGAGVPPEAQSHIFDRFYRADRARSRAEATMTSGAGLGLAIARWIAEAHGGTVTLESTGPEGSTFLVKLPAAALQPA